MWRIDKMLPIFGDLNVCAEVNDAPVGAGSGGSIFRASSPQIPGDLCVKALHDLTPGEARSLASFFKFLGEYQIDKTLENALIQGQLRRNLMAIREYLPTHFQYRQILGQSDYSMCILRRWCSGISLIECLNDEHHALHSDARYRLEVAKQLCRVLVGLSVFGVTHLDCYPDNVFIEDVNSEPVVTLIDLEGVGFAPNPSTIVDTGVPHRLPTAYEKEDFWITPWWFPTSGSKKFLKDGARWQLLMALMCVITRTRSAWFSWVPQNFPTINHVTEGIRSRSTPPTPLEVAELEKLLKPSKAADERAFEDDCFGSVDLAEHLRNVITLGIIGPKYGDTRVFLTDKDLKDLQTKITHVKI